MAKKLLLPYLWIHGMVGGLIVVVLSLVLTPTQAVVCVILFSTIREVLQFIFKGQEFTLEVLLRHTIDVVAYAAGAIPVAFVMTLLGF